MLPLPSILHGAHQKPVNLLFNTLHTLPISISGNPPSKFKICEMATIFQAFLRDQNPALSCACHSDHLSRYEVTEKTNVEKWFLLGYLANSMGLLKPSQKLPHFQRQRLECVLATNTSCVLFMLGREVELETYLLISEEELDIRSTEKKKKNEGRGPGLDGWAP